MRREIPKTTVYLESIWSGTLEVAKLFPINYAVLHSIGICWANSDFHDGFLNSTEIGGENQNIVIEKVLEPMSDALLLQPLAHGEDTRFEISFQTFSLLLSQNVLLKGIDHISFVRDRKESVRKLVLRWDYKVDFWKLFCFPFGSFFIPRDAWYIHG